MELPVGASEEDSSESTTGVRRWLIKLRTTILPRQSIPITPRLAIGVAIIMVAVAFGMRELIGPAELGLQFVTFFPAVALTAVYGGFWPGMLATGLSLVIATVLYFPPYGRLVFAWNHEVTISNLVFLMDELIVCTAIQVMQDQYRNLRLVSRRIRQDSEQLRAHIENSPMAVVEWDADFRVTQWSNEATQMFGWSASETVGKPIMDLNLIYGPDVPPVQQTMAKLSDGLSRYVVNANRNITKEGRVIHCIWYNSNLLDESGSMISTMSQVLDVTEQTEAQEALKEAKLEAEKANNAKSRFLAAVSHDLRQPLSALSIYVGSLEDKLTQVDRQLSMNMKNCVTDLNDMLSNLMDLSKLDAGVVTPEVKSFSVAKILARVMSSHAPEAKAKNLTLRCTYPDMVGCTDPVLFQRIVGNLVSNAVRYTNHGGVLIGCRRRAGKRWLEVWDSGVGIPAEKMTEIFEEFQQLANSGRNRANGTGLGLAIVAKTATLLGLEVQVRSQVGKGSVFAVELPMGDALSPVVTHRHSSQPVRIALVEDDHQVRHALTYALGQVGHQVVATDSCERLLSLLGDQAPHVLLTDYCLEGSEDGFDVVKSVRARFGKDIPAILITANTDASLTEQASTHDARLLHKPLDIRVVQAAIAESIQHEAFATVATDSLCCASGSNESEMRLA